MQKKRVRIYKPDNSNKFMYQEGGMSPQGAGMMPTEGQGPDLQGIVSTYAQAKGMSSEEANQLYNQIMQMSPEQQQQAVAQLTQELSSTQVPVARYGGDMGTKKRLMRKAIGGVSPNTTMENVVDNRRETVMNAIGANMARNLVDETYNEAQKASQLFNPYVQPQMQTGGESPFYGGMDPDNNPFLGNALNSQSDLTDAMGKLGNSVWNIGATMRPEDIKIKTKGDMFQPIEQPNDFFTQDNNQNAIPDYLQFDSNNYNLTGFQKGGGFTVNDNVQQGFDDLNIKDEDYIAAKKAYEQGSHTPEQLDIINRIEDYVAPKLGYAQSGVLNGWHGGFYFQDGKVIKEAQAPQRSNSPSSFMNERIDPFTYLNSPEGMQNFGESMKGFQPDNVYLSKLKSKSTPFGNKFVARWDYNEDGSGLPKGPNEKSKRDFGFNFGKDRQDNYGTFDKTFDQFQANLNTRRGDKLYEKMMGHPVGTQTGSSSNTPMTNFSGSGIGALEQMPYQEPSPYDPTLDYVPEQYDDGGMAGKLIIKQRNGINPMAGASGIIAGMNALSAAGNRMNIDENMTLADSINPILMDSRDRNPMSRGLWGTGALTGEEIPDLQPFNQGYRWSQGQGNGIMDQNQYSQNGGNTYQEGGVYELDEDEINEIMKNGGSIEYFD